MSVALAQERPIVVGVAISQTGAHAELAADYLKGIQLWREQVNEADGVLGRRVELRVLDDNSRAVRARELYAEMARDKSVDFLIGPYGSAATLLAAAEAERARRVMVNGAGPAAVVHSRPGRYVFQTSVPYAVYGLDVLQVAEAAEMRKLFIVARDDAASREMAEATQRAAQNGFAPAEVEIYRPGTLDFAAQVEKARAAKAEAWIAFGDVRDAAEMVKTFKRLEYAPPLFFAQSASHPRYIALLGQDAEFSLGAVDFDPRLSEAARAFAKTYVARWKIPVQLAAVEGFVAGTVLAAAVRSAGGLDTESVRAALAELEVPTALGTYRVRPENGAQIGFKPAVVQIRKGRPELGTPLLPYPQWNERALIK
ncbi:MAG TPA: ABC transporter substrate-binding protein [Burkholderiales bacterium]|nr:ABC transporter substrate-binding protein [Burkholderiales bacterium]